MIRLIVFVALLVPASAAAADFGPRMVVDTVSSNSGVGNPRVALSKSGDGVIAWGRRSRGPIAVADIPAEGGPGEPEVIGEGKGPRLAMNSSGRAAVAWSVGTSRHRVIWFSAREPGGDWTPAQRISPPRGTYKLADLDLLGNGTAVVAWTRRGRRERGQLARVTPAGDVRIRSLPAPSAIPQVALLGTLVTTLYLRPDVERGQDVSDIWIASDPSGASNTRHVRIVDDVRIFGAPSIDVDSVIAVGYLGDSAHHLVRVGDDRVRSDELGPRGGASAPRVAVDGDRTVVVWAQDDPCPGGCSPTLQSAGAHGFDALSEPVDPSGGKGAASPVIATGQGRFATVWTPGVIPAPYGAAVAELGEQPFAPAAIDGTDANANNRIALVMNRHGVGLVAYLSQDDLDAPTTDISVARLPAPSGR